MTDPIDPAWISTTTLFVPPHSLEVGDMINIRGLGGETQTVEIVSATLGSSMIQIGPVRLRTRVKQFVRRWLPWLYYPVRRWWP